MEKFSTSISNMIFVTLSKTIGKARAHVTPEVPTPEVADLFPKSKSVARFSNPYSAATSLIFVLPVAPS